MTCPYCNLRVYNEDNNEAVYHNYCFTLARIRKELGLSFEYIQDNLNKIYLDLSTSENVNRQSLARELEKFKTKESIFISK